MKTEEKKLLAHVKKCMDELAEKRKAAQEERNDYITAILSLDNETVGEAFKAYAVYLRDGKLAEIELEEIKTAHDLIAEIVLLDMWEC